MRERERAEAALADLVAAQQAERERERAARRSQRAKAGLESLGYLVDPRYLEAAGQSPEFVPRTLGNIAAGALEASALAAQTASDTFRQILGR